MTDEEAIVANPACDNEPCMYSKDGWSYPWKGGYGFYNYKAHQCIYGSWSAYGCCVLFSAFSLVSTWSIFCTLGLFSIASFNSTFSILSFNSCFSILSTSSLFAIGCTDEAFKICYGGGD